MALTEQDEVESVFVGGSSYARKSHKSYPLEELKVINSQGRGVIWYKKMQERLKQRSKPVRKKPVSFADSMMGALPKIGKGEKKEKLPPVKGTWLGIQKQNQVDRRRAKMMEQKREEYLRKVQAEAEEAGEAEGAVSDNDEEL
eukprot:gene17636-23979_t